MLFGSLEFYLFFIAVFVCWSLTPVRYRWLVLLGASYYFYFTWNPWYLVVLVFCTGASWWLAVRIDEAGDAGDRKYLFLLAVAANLGPLLFFKYFSFFADSISSVSSLLGLHPLLPHFEILFPVGISFFTLQAVSYSADVYQGRIEPERNPGIFALYLSFFPRLISGPIERGKNLLPRLRDVKPFDSSLFLSGVQLFFWGLFKKLVLADRMGMYVDMVYSHPGDYSGWTVMIAVWLYGLQIYCDFSAYMDMAIGCGRAFGIELSPNFNFPYMAHSIADFWRRWHITLTSWFRDYVYFPMGGNRVSAGRWAINIMVVFLVSGLWHGAAWTFFIWGGLHGFFYLFGRLTAPARAKLQQRLELQGKALAVVQVLVTFHLVAFAWIFFRAGSVHDAWQVISHLFVNLSLPPQMMASQFSTYLAWSAALVFVVLELLRYWDATGEMRYSLAVPGWCRYPVYVAVLLATSLLGVSSNQFIYFHF